ncbi:hypothetical protein LguiA_034181 [Lonicera macranthoides]
MALVINLGISSFVIRSPFKPLSLFSILSSASVRKWQPVIQTLDMNYKTISFQTPVPISDYVHTSLAIA